ncbi:hypothetical protein DOY81_014865, partial [Sarcophaga bullata]
PRADSRRPKNLSDLAKFLDDRWLAKTAEKEMAEYETDELCPSMYSFHSSPDEKNRLLYNLADCGIETNVDRHTKKMRIKEWIESSVITEEDEEELDETNSASSPSSSVSREPVRGHISSLRTSSTEKPKEIKTTLKDANQKHFDPRTGVVQQGPSEMGVVNKQKSESPFSTASSNMSMINNNDSLAGSMLTLGSRPDLLASSMEIYNSASTDLNRLGEPNGSLDQLSYQTLSNSNLVLTQAPLDYVQNSPQMTTIKNSIGVNTGRPLTPNKSILHRSKSDNLRAALFASTPTLDNNNSVAWNMPNKTVQPQSNHNNKSVTFTGLANSFQTMAPIIMPSNFNINIQQNTSTPATTNQVTSPTHTPKQTQAQPQYQYTNNNNNNNNNKNTKSNYYDSPVKDSAYGSSETTNDFYSSPYQTNMNGKMNGNTPSPVRQNTVSSTVRTQSSQQQRSYSGALTSSMKDTAYDRSIINNNNNNNNNNNLRRK